MNKRTALLLFFALFFLTTTIVYWLRIGFAFILLREGLYLSTSLLATLAGIFALKMFGIKNERAKTLLFLTLGIGYWFMGEVLFNYYEYVLQIDPYPSAADIFYVLAYPLLLIGLINEIRIAQITWRKIHKPTVFLFGLVAFLLSLVVFYFGIYQAYDAQKTVLGNIVAMSYGVGDLLLILANIFVLILVWEFRGGKLSRVWLLMFFSFILTLVADILFAIFNEQYDAQLWFYKSLLDFFWMISYLLFAAALFEFGFSIQDALKKLVKSGKGNKHE